MTNANTVCTCGARYSAFRATGDAGSTLTFAEVHAMLRVGFDDSSLWNNRSRGAVLRFWSFLKRAQWETMHGYCDSVAATDSTVDELPEWVTDSTVVELDAAGNVIEAELELDVEVAPVAEVVELATVALVAAELVTAIEQSERGAHEIVIELGARETEEPEQGADRVCQHDRRIGRRDRRLRDPRHLRSREGPRGRLRDPERLVRNRLEMLERGHHEAIADRDERLPRRVCVRDLDIEDARPGDFDLRVAAAAGCVRLRDQDRIRSAVAYREVDPRRAEIDESSGAVANRYRECAARAANDVEHAI